MKSIIFVIAVFAIVSIANAQSAQTSTKSDKNISRTTKDGRLALCLDLGIPMGDDADVYSFAIGGAFRGELNLGKITALTAAVGYQVLTLKVRHPGNTYAVPVLLGIKIYARGQQDGFYGQVQGGFTMKTVDYGFVAITNTDITYGPGIGYHFENLDIGLNFLNMTTAGGSNTSYMLGARVAAVFGSR